MPLEKLAAVSFFGLACTAIVACKESEPSDKVHYARPQILPEKSPICLGTRTVRVGESITEAIQLTNYGEATLEIDASKIALEGDVRSAFSIDGIAPMTGVAEGESAVLQIRYRPSAAGWDTATLVVPSNAENYPELRIFLMARGVPNDLDAGSSYDAGPMPDVGACRDI